MTKAVLLHRPDSIYEDEPETVYDFPRRYLRTMEKTVGDWIAYFEPVKAGLRGYFAVAKVQRIIPKPHQEGRFLALIERGTFLPFENETPRLKDGRPWESLVSDTAGYPKPGGWQQSAVRPLPEDEFDAIVNQGLPVDLENFDHLDYHTGRNEIDEVAPIFRRPVIERLQRRPYRDVAFRRKVRAAYDFKCAISGIELRNGGGRPEVQAAHIKPVESGGNDAVRNGIALSGTLHWMFDRGLISIEPETHRILVSHNKVPSDIVNRLIRSELSLRLPNDERNWPHPNYFNWHREYRFGRGDFESGPPDGN